MNSSITIKHSRKKYARKHSLQHAIKHYHAGNYRSSREICEGLYLKDASNVDSLILLGAVHFQLKNLSESMFYSQQCIRINPTSCEAHSIMGNCLKELGDIESAVGFFVKAVRIQPRFADAYNNLAITQFLNGQPSEAIKSLQVAISLDPSHSDALTNLGNIYKAIGRPDDAKKQYLAAVRVNPKCAIAWSNLAGVFHDWGDTKRAIASYQQSIKIAPSFADAYSNLGNSLAQHGKSEAEPKATADALISYKKALKLRNNFALAHGNLALGFLEKGEVNHAIRELHTSLFLDPKYTDALTNLGGVYIKLGNLNDSTKVCLRAIRLKPDHPYAHINIGVALRNKGLLREALHCFTVATRSVGPSRAIAHSCLGATLVELGRIQSAAKALREAINIDPLCMEAYINLGNAYIVSRKIDYAKKCFITAAGSLPSCTGPTVNLMILNQSSGKLEDALIGLKEIARDVKCPQEALIQSVFLSASLCEWSTRSQDFQTVKNIIEKSINEGEGAAMSGIQPFHSAFIPDLSPDLSLKLCQSFAHRVRQKVDLIGRNLFSHRLARGDGKINIGYVSSAFDNSPTGIMTQGIYRFHDRERFEVYCYSLSQSCVSFPLKQTRQTTEHFREVGLLDDGAIAKHIFDDEIHILVNLDGYVDGARTEIFALRPSPVQVAMMGLQGTMGADFIDYFVANETVVPQEHRVHYLEKIMYVPHVVNDCQSSASHVIMEDLDSYAIRSLYGIPDDVFIYACFQRPHNIDPELFGVWMNILREVEESMFLMVRYNYGMEARLKVEAEKRGVEPERLLFLDPVPHYEHMKRCRIVDMFLDTKVCSGAASSCEALWTATPMIALKGDRACNRIGASVLESMGLDDLVVEDMEDYEYLAISLNADQERYIDIIQRLEESRSNCELFNIEIWVRRFESGLKIALSKFEEGLAPDHILL